MIIGLADKKLSTRTDDFWIAPSASVIGDVQLGDKSSIWFNSTIISVGLFGASKGDLVLE